MICRLAHANTSAIDCNGTGVGDLRARSVATAFTEKATSPSSVTETRRTNIIEWKQEKTSGNTRSRGSCASGLRTELVADQSTPVSNSLGALCRRHGPVLSPCILDGGSGVAVGDMIECS